MNKKPYCVQGDTIKGKNKYFDDAKEMVDFIFDCPSGVYVIEDRWRQKETTIVTSKQNKYKRKVVIFND